SRERGINLKCSTEDHVFQGQRRSAELGFGFRYPGAKVMEQSLEFVLLRGLRSVVVWPVLRIGLALCGGDRHGFSDSGRTIGVFLLYDRVRHGKDVLASLAAQFKVGAVAYWILTCQINSVKASPALSGNCPDFTFV